MKKILAAILFCFFCLGVMGFSACMSSGQQEEPVSSSKEESNISSDSSSGEHEYGELIAEKPATCEENGVKAHYHCDHCGKDFDEAKQLLEDLVIPALGHDYGELIAEIPATCEGEGVKAHYHCDRCGKDFDEAKQLIEDLVIPALGHDYGELIAEIPATCEGEGVKAHYHCDRCGKDFDEAKQLIEDLVIPALGHNYGEWIEEVPATATEPGTKGHYHCDRCGKDFDEEKHLLEDLVIPASGHDYGELIAEIPATCEEDGVKAHYHCNICGKDFDEAKQLIEDLVIPASGHDYGEWIEEIPATATEPGTKGHYHCDRCEKDFDSEYKILESLVISKIIPIVIPEVGGTMTFGNYHEATEWIVLKKDAEKTLIIAKDIIDSKPYHQPGGNITWENCTLRAWLNSEYINAAFTAEERNRILTTHVVNNDNTHYNSPIPGGNDTEDKVFLLSIEEAQNYFADNAVRKAKGTEYAKGNNLDVYDGYSFWWLRSPGHNSGDAAGVFASGGVDYGDCYYDVGYSVCGVRPALWISNQ